MSPAVLETAIKDSERPQTHPLESAATGIATIQFIFMAQQPLVGQGRLITEAP